MFYWKCIFIMTSSNGNIFRVTGPLCGEFTGPGEFPTQRPVTRSFDVFFHLCLNKRLNKQPWGWWFETLSWSLWRHSNVEWGWWETWMKLCSYCELSQITWGCIASYQWNWILWNGKNWIRRGYGKQKYLLKDWLKLMVAIENCDFSSYQNIKMLL